jgi:hypothetical protein
MSSAIMIMLVENNNYEYIKRVEIKSYWGVFPK